ncbi:MAG: TIGR02186 family protein [Pseudomonadota bacterium]
MIGIKRFLMAVLFSAHALVAYAQDEAAERIEIGLSTEVIEINSNFAGETLTIFGSVDNIDPLVQRQGRYDVVVVLSGPVADLTARRKDRVFGVWMNVDELELPNVPLSYLITSTRQIRDMAEGPTIERLALDIASVNLIREEDVRQKNEEFLEEVRRLKIEEELFRSFPAGVQFISQSLFRARLELPANVPLGQHVARAYLFKQGGLVGQTNATLNIRKAGLEFAVFEFSRDQSVAYGFLAVLAALAIGWLGRIVFKRD